MKIPISHSVLCVLALLLPGLSGCAKGCGQRDTSATALLSQVEEFRLENGMQWLLVQREGAPVFTGMVSVKVGGIEEPPGKAGLAHMFEHMAFKGSAEIGVNDRAAEAAVLDEMRALDRQITQARAAAVADHTVKALLAKREALAKTGQQYVVNNEVWRIFQEHGAAELNAFTSEDQTAYYARMPSDALGVWIYLTSEIVGRPVLREFYAERSVVMEERRSSVDNSPSGKLYEALLATAYTTSPYRESTIGSMQALEGLTMEDAEAFHAAYYRPERMIGVIVGNFDLSRAKKDIRRFWGALSAGSAPMAVFPKEPPQEAERTVEVIFDAGPRIMLAYHKPTLPHRDDYIFDAIQYILCGGESGRLVRALEQELRIARSVVCWTGSPGARLNNLFMISAEPVGTHTMAEVLTAIEAVLARLRRELVAGEELVKVRTNLRAAFLWDLNSSESLANQLAYFQTMLGDWRYVVNHGKIMDTITGEDVRRVAADYLNVRQRTVATLRRPE